MFTKKYFRDPNYVKLDGNDISLLGDYIYVFLGFVKTKIQNFNLYGCTLYKLFTQFIFKINLNVWLEHLKLHTNKNI